MTANIEYSESLSVQEPPARERRPSLRRLQFGRRRTGRRRFSSNPFPPKVAFDFLITNTGEYRKSPILGLQGGIARFNTG